VTAHCKNCKAEGAYLSPRHLCGVCEYCKAKEAEAQRDAARTVLHKIRRLMAFPSTKLTPEQWDAVKRGYPLTRRPYRGLTLEKRWDRIKQLLETP
jgi:hypothetical protein